ncbi:MAG: putative protein N(5)-glutamine methyltransferase, partial [Aldersonia sp.]|nr:putative protein N(5)-glutamine methyltransferase [Aldersonia sp.]
NGPSGPPDALALWPAEPRLYEPAHALDGGTDGWVRLRGVAAAAPRWLRPGGHLLIETSERQAPAAIAAFSDAGLITRLVESEELLATVVVGARPADQ